MADFDRTLVQWLNANRLSREVHGLGDLADGMLLMELMNQVSAEDFPVESLQPTEEWPARLANLKKLHSSLVSYLETQLKLHHPLISEELDLVSVAISSDPAVLVKLLQLSILAITHCEKKSIFITRIMKQGEALQTHLMFFIQRILEKGEKNPVEEQVMKSSVSELVKLRKEKRTLSVKVDKSELRLDLLQRNKESAEQQLEELRMRNLDLENQLLRRVKVEAASPANDVLMDSLETSLVQKDRIISQLQAELEDTRRIAESRLAALKDEIDLANERASRLPDLEHSLQNCRRKLEDFSDVKKQLRAAQEEIGKMRKENQAIREEGEAEVVRQIVPLREELSRLKQRLAKSEETVQERDRTVKELRGLVSDMEERLQLSDLKCRHANEQLDHLLENSSEDSFSVTRSPRSSGDFRPHRDTESPEAVAEGRKRVEEELQIARNELARLKVEQSASVSLHAQEVATLQAKVAVLDKEFTASTHQLHLEKSELLAKVQFIETHYKQLDNDFSSIKREKETLQGEIRILRKDKEDLTARFIDSREQEMKLIEQLGACQVLLQTAEAEQSQLVQKLSESQAASQSLKSLRSDFNEAQRSLEDITQLFKSEQEKAKYLAAEVTRWRRLVQQKDSEITYLSRAKEELSKVLAEERGLLQEVMQEMDSRLADISASVRPAK